MLPSSKVHKYVSNCANISLFEVPDNQATMRLLRRRTRYSHLYLVAIASGLLRKIKRPVRNGYVVARIFLYPAPESTAFLLLSFQQRLLAFGNYFVCMLHLIYWTWMTISSPTRVTETSSLARIFSLLSINHSYFATDPHLSR